MRPIPRLFLRPKFSRLIPRLFFETKYFRDRYRDFFSRLIPRLFSRLIIFETDTETFFRDQNFRDRDRYSQKIEKSLDTEKSRDEMSHSDQDGRTSSKMSSPYLIFVIFFTLAKFLENKIYTEKRQFFALNL